MTSAPLPTQEAKLKAIISSAVKDGSFWLVPSRTEKGRKYRVTGFSCTCKGFEVRGKCAHIDAVSLLCPPVEALTEGK